MPTGWRPADLLESAVDHSPEQARRYDPASQRGQVIFAVIEFVQLLAITTVLFMREETLDETLDETHAIVLCLAIACGLWLIGAVLQSRLRITVVVIATLPVMVAAFCTFM